MLFQGFYFILFHLTLSLLSEINIVLQFAEVSLGFNAIGFKETFMFIKNQIALQTLWIYGYFVLLFLRL